MSLARPVTQSLVGLLCLFAAAIVPMAGLGSAAAATREPDRYAFVAGIGSYTEHGSAFDDLLTACEEAIAFRKQLIGLGWSRSHIFPIVAEDGAGVESEEAVRQAVCDLSNDQIKAGLIKFSNLMIDDKGYPYGVVYLSGHGAQSNGNQYFFGVNSNIDFLTELNRAAAGREYKVFADEGVDVLSIIRRASDVPGSAMLVIIDACRNNPALEKYKQELAAAALANPSLDNRLRAGYMAEDAAAHDVTDDFGNIILLFSARPEREAAGAAAGSTTEFSKTVMDMLGDPRAVRSPAPGLVDGIITESKRKQVSLPKFDKQIPDRLGSMGLKPAFCLLGCPQPLEDWPTRQRIKLVTDASKGKSERVARANFPVAGFPTLAMGSRLASWAPASSPPAILSDPRGVQLPPPVRTMNVKAFYCVGDDKVAARESAAGKFAARLKRQFPPSNILAGYQLADVVRVQSFDPVSNPAMARGKTGVTTVWIDARDADERAWAESMVALQPSASIKENRISKTRDFVSIFFCDALGPEAQPTSTVYVQVPRKEDIDKAKPLLGRLDKVSDHAVIFPTIEDVDRDPAKPVRSPQNSEVRYYTDNQQATALKLAGKLKAHLKYPPNLKKLNYAKPSSNPVIEVWIGLQEADVWRSGPGQWPQ